MIWRPFQYWSGKSGGKIFGHAQTAFVLYLIILSLSFTRPAIAHPHAWIDMKTDVLFSKTGEITGIHHDWLFDEGYSIFILQNLSKNKISEISPDELQVIANKIMLNLTPYDYFTEMMTSKSGDATQKLKIKANTPAEAKLKGKRFNMTFVIPLQKPTSADGFIYKVFDPTYFVEMLHTKSDGIHLMDAPETCKYTLIPPNPPMEAIIKATALDLNDATDSQLGTLFAEKVKISCQ